MPTGKNSYEPQMLISYTLLRRLIGCLAFSLPILLAFGGILYGGCTFIESSISDYYHTEMRNLFVGTLSAIALFMFTYRGYDKRDNVAGNLACIFALGVAFFPTSVDTVSQCATNCISYDKWISTVHLTSAFLLFSVLIYFSLVLFPLSKDDKGHLSKQKKQRNTIYHISGYIMIACIIEIVLYFAFFDDNPDLQKLDLVFWLETIALWAFGTAWLTKGQVIYRDVKS
jgi:hypothetical protein